jgi:hypothetical protein
VSERFTREDDPLHLCDLCDRDAVEEHYGLYRCTEHRLPLAPDLPEEES